MKNFKNILILCLFAAQFSNLCLAARQKKSPQSPKKHVTFAKKPTIIPNSPSQKQTQAPEPSQEAPRTVCKNTECGQDLSNSKTKLTFGLDPFCNEDCFKNKLRQVLSAPEASSKTIPDIYLRDLINKVIKEKDPTKLDTLYKPLNEYLGTKEYLDTKDSNPVLDQSALSLVIEKDDTNYSMYSDSSTMGNYILRSLKNPTYSGNETFCNFVQAFENSLTKNSTNYIKNDYRKYKANILRKLTHRNSIESCVYASLVVKLIIQFCKLFIEQQKIVGEFLLTEYDALIESKIDPYKRDEVQAKLDLLWQKAQKNARGKKLLKILDILHDVISWVILFTKPELKQGGIRFFGGINIGVGNSLSAVSYYLIRSIPNKPSIDGILNFVNGIGKLELKQIIKAIANNYQEALQSNDFEKAEKIKKYFIQTIGEKYFPGILDLKMGMIWIFTFSIFLYRLSIHDLSWQETI